MHLLRAQRRTAAGFAALMLPLVTFLAVPAPRATAQDSAGVVVLTSPASEAVLTGTATATVDIGPAAGRLRVVSLYGKSADGAIQRTLAEDTTEPYEFAFDTRHFPNGPWTLSAIASFESVQHPGMLDHQQSEPAAVSSDNPAEIEIVTPAGTLMRGQAAVTARVLRPTGCEDRLLFDYESRPDRNYYPPVTAEVGPDGTATAILDVRWPRDPQVQVTVRRAYGFGCRTQPEPQPVAATAVFDVSQDRPTTAIISPASLTRYTAPLAVQVSATPAPQAQTPIREVRLYDWLGQVAVDTSAPWGFVLDPRQRRLGDDSSAYYVVAVDETGMESVSHHDYSHLPGPKATAVYTAQTPVRLSTAPAAGAVGIGKATTITITAVPADPRAVLNGLPVTLQSRSWGNSTWTNVARPNLAGPSTPGARAAATVTVAPRINTAYRAVTAGRADAAPATTAERVVKVVPRLTLVAPTATTMTVRKGTAVTLTSRLAPAWQGHRVLLQQRTATGWRNLTAVYASPTGGVTARWTAPRTGTSSVLRFFTPATSRFNASSSPAFTVRLR